MTNLIPFIFSMGSILVIQKAATGKTDFVTNICAVIGLIYSFYALYACGTDAPVWGSMVTFLGIALYGIVSPKYDLEAAVAYNKKIDAEKAAQNQ